MDPVSRSAPPTFTPFTELEPVDKPPNNADDANLEPRIDYKPVSYFVEANDLGRGPYAAHFSFMDAVRKMIFG